LNYVTVQEGFAEPEPVDPSGLQVRSPYRTYARRLPLATAEFFSLISCTYESSNQIAVGNQPDA